MRTLNYYYLYKNQGLCPKCGKREPTDGRVLCPDCLERNRTSQRKNKDKYTDKKNQGQRADYAYLKKKHICVSCRVNETYFGHARCPDCMEKYRAYNNSNRNREYQKERRERLKAQGLCVSCGKNPTNGYTRCEACRSKYGYLTNKNIGQTGQNIGQFYE